MNADSELTLRRLEATVEHIQNVQRNAWALAKKLIENDEHHLARELVANSLRHDQSKLNGIEWDFLLTDPKTDDDKSKLVLAISNHNRTNSHHPEFWPDGIGSMSDVALAEMVCDWKSRSDEHGTDLREWMKEKAPKRYDYPTGGKVYKRLKYFSDLILGDGFKTL
jgi:hypothetical protein